MQSAPEPNEPKKRGNAVAAALITGALVALVCVPVGLLIGAAVNATPYFDQASVQGEVQRVLQDDYGLAEVSEVSCPGEVAAEQGAQFECTFVFQETQQSVPVQVGSEDGQLLIGSPVE